MGEGPVRQHCPVRRVHHVPRHCRPYAEGDHRSCSQHYEDQDHCSTREEVLCLDRRIHPGLPLHLPADVDLQAGVRRVRPIHCPPQVLLSANFFVLFIFIYKIFENLGKCLSTNISIWFSTKTSPAINTSTWYGYFVTIV